MYLEKNIKRHSLKIPLAYMCVSTVILSNKTSYIYSRRKENVYTVVFKGGKPPLFYTKITVHPFCLITYQKTTLKGSIVEGGILFTKELPLNPFLS